MTGTDPCSGSDVIPRRPSRASSAGFLPTLIHSHRQSPNFFFPSPQSRCPRSYLASSLQPTLGRTMGEREWGEQVLPCSSTRLEGGRGARVSHCLGACPTTGVARHAAVSQAGHSGQHVPHQSGGRGRRARAKALSPTSATRRCAWGGVGDSVFPTMVRDARDLQVESLPWSALTPAGAGLSPPGIVILQVPLPTSLSHTCSPKPRAPQTQSRSLQVMSCPLFWCAQPIGLAAWILPEPAWALPRTSSRSPRSRP